MKILFFGLGSIGTRHVRLIKRLYRHELYAFRSGKNKSKNTLGLKEIHRWQDLGDIKPDVAFITNPTFLHVETAIRSAQKGMALFIEKPLGNDTGQIADLFKIVEEKRIATYVAYCLRFHPVILYLKNQLAKYSFLHMRMTTTSYLPSWRLGKKYLENYSAHTKLGGGVINDLSHELDSAQFILGPIRAIKGQFAKRSHLTVDAEDYADILVETKSGPANIHINFLSQMEQRVIQMDFKEKSVVGDVIHNTVFEYKNGKPVKRIQFQEPRDHCYQEQLRYFFKNIKNRRMMNNVFEAFPLLKKIQELKRTNHLR